jgi:recombination protein RecR
MSVLPRSVEKVIEEFQRLPGIGPKSAARMAYFFLRAPENRALLLAKALVELKKTIVTCESCYNVADRNPCSICSDSRRDHSKICVVEEPLDVVALEKSGVYEGLYFVLGGVISPADGIGPEELRMGEFGKRLKKELGGQVETITQGAGSDSVSHTDNDKIEKRLEVIMATNPSLEGEATASYILDIVRKFSANSKIPADTIKISRLAMGLPTGADLEYADRLTLKRSLEGRIRIG